MRPYNQCTCVCMHVCMCVGVDVYVCADKGMSSTLAGSTYQSAGDSVHHDPLWEVHGVCNSQHHQSGLEPAGPVKQMVQHRLLPGPQ